MNGLKLKRSRAALVALAVWVALPVQAETLTDTLVSAYNNSDLLGQSRAILRAADEDVAIAVSALRPTLNYNLSRDWGFIQDNRAIIDRDTVIDTLELTSSLTLLDFGKNRLAIEAKKEAVLASRFALLQQEQAVLFQAVQAYMDVLAALEFVDLRTNNVRVLNEQVRAANDRFEVGEVTRTDVAQAQSRLAESEANLESAQGDLDIAREAYKLAVGRYPNRLNSPPALPEAAASEDAARKMAVRAHPLILQAQRLVSVAELNMGLAEAQVLPTLSATARAGYSNTPNQASNGELEPAAAVGIEFGGPIYQGGRLNALFRQAQAQQDLNRSQLLRTTSEISEQVGRAWAVREVARARLKSTARQIEAAQIAFDGTREEATLGARTTLDVLDAEQELLDARGDRIVAATEEQIAVYGLLSSMGQLTGDTLGVPVTSYDPSVYYNAVRNAPAISNKSARGIKLDRVLKSIGKY